MSSGDWSVLVGVVMEGGEGKRGVGVGCVADVSRRSRGSGCISGMVVVIVVGVVLDGKARACDGLWNPGFVVWALIFEM